MKLTFKNERGLRYVTYRQRTAAEQSIEELQESYGAPIQEELFGLCLDGLDRFVQICGLPYVPNARLGHELTAEIKKGGPFLLFFEPYEQNPVLGHRGLPSVDDVYGDLETWEHEDETGYFEQEDMQDALDREGWILLEDGLLLFLAHKLGVPTDELADLDFSLKLTYAPVGETEPQTHTATPE